MKSKILPIILLLMGVVFVILGLNAKREKADLDARGISVPGTIASADIRRGSKNKKKYHIKVNWQDGATAQVQQDFEVREKFYKAHVNDTTVINPQVTVRHIPGESKTAIIEGGSTDFGGMEWLGYAFSGGGLLMGFFAFRRRRVV